LAWKLDRNSKPGIQAIVPDDRGNLFVLDEALTKYDADGKPSWSRAIASSDGARRMALEGSQGVVIAWEGHDHITIARFDGAGERSWSADLEDPSGGESQGGGGVQAIGVTSEGEIRVAVSAHDKVQSLEELLFVASYDRTGAYRETVRCERERYDPSNFRQAWRNITFGAYAMCPSGRTLIVSSGGKDYTVESFDSTGKREWVSPVLDADFHKRPFLNDIVCGNDGAAYVAGEYDLRPVVVRLSPSGETVWRYAPSDSMLRPEAIALGAGGQVYLAATMMRPEYVIRSLNDRGRLLWDYTLPSSAPGAAVSDLIAVDASGAVYLTGHSEAWVKRDEDKLGVDVAGNIFMKLVSGDH
jgi:outer membrane protein assembly factor BamB